LSVSDWHEFQVGEEAPEMNEPRSFDLGSVVSTDD